MSKVTAGGDWYRQPILWLGAAILFASLTGCISMVVLGTRYGDESLPITSERLLKMPAARSTGSAG
ncbi:hypothetical protein JM946_25855 [Steroidobacter sp. S1-65]|uniref:Lipoprotein n=1 Tax=Steroidobacter gossypii TaxID=2805490 RepID=A0ABS1X4N3_9GAMM|nr:hypothetical protein [Steroidobacter gossypii]MBM0108172.1 hypothetical protein [Steroidobacter gossypii]